VSIPTLRPGEPAAPVSGPRATLWVLRIAVTAHLLLVALQPVLAGAYLSGDFDALGAHGSNAGYVTLVGLAVLVCALAYWLGGRGRGWVPAAAATIWVAEVLQTGFGYARLLGLHIPLGVTIVTGAVLLTAWAWRPGARRSRPVRR
jgi:hypothetical protein